MATGKNLRRSKSSKSVCERSAKIAINVVRISSLCIANMVLGSTRDLAKTKTVAGATMQSWYQDTGSMQLQEPESKIAKYVMQPDEQTNEGDDAGNGIDQRAIDYITSFKERNRLVGDDVRDEASKCIPPPPNPALRRS